MKYACEWGMSKCVCACVYISACESLHIHIPYTEETVPLCVHEVNKCVRQHSSIHPIRCSSTRFIHLNFNKPILRVEIENFTFSKVEYIS